MNELVSVIMAAYNAERYIAASIKSIQNQTYENWELIICDDCSSDNTYSIIKQFSYEDCRIKVLCNDSNKFSSHTRNRCIDVCNGKYVMIQDADDLSYPTRIETLVKVIEECNNVDFVSSRCDLFNEFGVYKSNAHYIEYPTKYHFLYGLPFCHAATLFNRDCLNSVGGYRISKETRRGQDYDLFMRLYAKGYKGKNIRDILYSYRVDSETISRRKFKYRIDECKIRYKGFKELGILKIGLLFVLKPIFAHVLQIIRNLKR